MTTAEAPFTPPGSCSTTWIGTDAGVSVGVECSSGTLIDDKNCFPSTTTACPFSWTAVRTAGSITTCCPGGFDFHTDGERCYSTAGGYVLGGITCAPSQIPTSVAVTYTFTPGVWAVDVSYVGAITSTSATSTETSSLATSTATSSSVPRITSPTPTPTTSSPSTPSAKPSLSAGAIAGIVIGSICAVALVLALIVFLKKRHGKSKMASEHQSLSHPPDTYYNITAELDAKPPLPYSEPFKADPVELENHPITPHAKYRQ
ncbi:hypothetical protein K491DRAFT_691372 [Lophiostoma macrostomum CBS 122681]|uniref:Mid2 domain-containing protein n=1 Tax=Lophiostoma macrostomum CBS 122681 TaxID=1314788 RepID=A0A6A6TB07_9PLEO|nr:hypothetical protein K491DRAFT_691372 [Lophiostoma macrostomum CBS 122681]